MDQLPVERVVLAPATARVEPQKTTTLKATALDIDGKDLNYTPDKFAWTSSDPTKATVSASGVVTGVGAGEVTIKATERQGGKTATALVTVAVNSAEELYLDGQSGIESVVLRILGPRSAQVASTRRYSVYQNNREYSYSNYTRDARSIFYLNQSGTHAANTYRATWAIANASGSGLRDFYTFTQTDVYSFVPSVEGSKVLLYVNSSGSVQTPGRLALVDTSSRSEVAWPNSTSIHRLQTMNPRMDRYVATTFPGFETYLFSKDGSLKVRLATDSVQSHSFSATTNRLCLVTPNADTPAPSFGSLPPMACCSAALRSRPIVWTTCASIPSVTGFSSPVRTPLGTISTTAWPRTVRTSDSCLTIPASVSTPTASLLSSTL